MKKIEIIPTTDGVDKVLVKNIELEVETGCYALPRDLGYDLSIGDLELIQYGILIVDNDGFRTEPVSTIIDYKDGNAIVEMITFGPTGIVNELEGYSEDQFITAMRRSVSEHSELIIHPEDKEEPEFDLDSFIECTQMGVKYSHLGPFRYTTIFSGPTYGDIILQIESLVIKLEKRAAFLLKNNLI